MREEAKAAAAAAAAGMMPGQQNFQTMPTTPGAGPLTNPNTPAHQRNQNAAQTMFNVIKISISYQHAYQYMYCEVANAFSSFSGIGHIHMI